MKGCCAGCCENYTHSPSFNIKAPSKTEPHSHGMLASGVPFLPGPPKHKKIQMKGCCVCCCKKYTHSAILSICRRHRVHISIY